MLLTVFWLDRFSNNDVCWKQKNHQKDQIRFCLGISTVQNDKYKM